MKKFFGNLKNWFSRHKPTKRRLIQVYAALLYNANIKGFASGRIYTGNTKYACVPGLNCYSCPGAVGACPLGALQNALASSDTKAPFYVLGIIILFGLLLGRTICGFLCPMGLIQELLYKIKSPKLKKSKVTRVLSYFKYVLLIAFVIIIPLSFIGVTAVPAFCKYICPAGMLEGSLPLLSNSGNGSFFEKLGPVFTWKLCMMIAIIVGSIFVFRLFCRFLCPLGALYSLFCKVAMIGVKLDKQKCVDCGLCIQTCKMDIKHVGDHECIHCGECLKVCPTHAISWKGSKIFLHANAIEQGGESAAGEKVALADLLNGGTTAAKADVAQLNGGVIAVNVEAEKTEAENAVCAEIAAENVQNAKDERALKKMEKQRQKANKRAERKAMRGTAAYVKKRNRVLEIIAWVAALAVLAGALVYYNFIHEEVEAETVYTVGDEFPEFTAKKFFADGGDETYSSADDLADGKIVILNFWYIGCGGCETEIPYFGALASDSDYADKVSVVIVHAGNSDFGAEDAYTYEGEQMQYLEYYVQYKRDWSFYNSATWIMDAEDSSSLYLQLGGGGGYPMTAIIGTDGTIEYITYAGMEFDQLYSVVDDILAE